MKLIMLACFGVILLISCSHSTDAAPTQQLSDSPATGKAAALPPYFYKKLHGTIGEKNNVTVHLIKRRDSLNNQSIFTGYYYYDKTGMPLQLSGTVSDSGTFKLAEFTYTGEHTGDFTGKFTGENEAAGTWMSRKTNKTFAFQLTAIEADNNLFAFSEYYNENCKNRNRNLKSTKKDTLDWTDTMCSSIHLELTSLAGRDAVSAKINRSLLKFLLTSTAIDDHPTSIQDLMHGIDGENDYRLEAEYSVGIVSNEKHVLSMRVSGWQNSGGAHPNGFSFFINYNKETGDTISLPDIVKRETIDELVIRAKQQFIKENGNIKDNGWFFDGKFVLPLTFSITKGGILFLYQQYEAGPYAMGMPQFFLSWQQLKDIMKPEYLE